MVKLEQVCGFQGGTQPPKSTFVSTPTYNHVRLLQIRDFKSDDFVTFVSTKYNLRYVEECDILLARYGASVGKVFTGKKGAINVALMKANPDEKLVFKPFLFYFLQSAMVQSYLKGLGGRSAQAGFNRSEIGRINFSLPPLPEQRAIASVLGAIQEAKFARQKEIALERERKAALMDYLFSHGTKDEPRTQTEIGEIPERWQLIKLGSHAKLITKGSSPKWQGFDYCDTGIIFVRSQNVGLGRLELDDVVYLPKEFNVKEKKSILQKGDLLINIVGASIGRAAVASDIVRGGNVNQAVAITRLKQGMAPYFVMTYLLTLAGQIQLHSQKKDVARANLSLQDVDSLLIPLPTVAEQNEICAAARACDDKITALEQETARLDELFHAMLEELMTGKRSAVPLIDVDLPN